MSVARRHSQGPDKLARALRISYRHHEDTSPAKRVLTISRPRASGQAVSAVHPHIGQGARGLEDGKDDGLLRIVSELEHFVEIRTTEEREIAILTSFYPIPLASCPTIVGAVENRNPGMVARSCLYLIVVSSSFQREVRAQGSVCQLPPRAGAAHGP